METAINLFCDNAPPVQIPLKYRMISLKSFKRNERKLLKAILVNHLHHLFCDLYKKQLRWEQKINSMECYAMDSKIIQLLLQDIIETGEYTLEGIAFYTRIPFDIIYEAACGIKNQISITPWARIVDLYLQVKPEASQILIEKLVTLLERNKTTLSILLKEE